MGRLNAFETPRWVQALASRHYLRSIPAITDREPQLTDDEAITEALRVARELAPEATDED